jgi:hypothetical protein
VMPSVGRRKQLLILGVTAAVLGVSAPRASADNEVWYWACQAPDGSALKFSPASPPNGFQFVGSGGGSINFGGANACDPSAIKGALAPKTQGGAVEGLAQAAAVFAAPSSTQITNVRLSRATHGFTAPQAGDNQTYTVTTANSTLESLSRTTATGDLSGEITKAVANGPSSGDFVRVAVKCDTASGNVPCGNDGVSFDLSRLGVQVTEPGNDVAPHVAVGGASNPMAGQPTLDILANDSGVGLRDVTASWEGTDQSWTASFNDADPAKYANCQDLVAGGAADLPLGAVCPTAADVKLKIDTSKLSNADHVLVVQTRDWAGHTWTFRQTTTILNNPDLGTNTQTLSIGTSGITTTPGTTNTGGGSTGGVAGASSQICSTPRLSVVLADKPYKVSKGVPVLLSNKRYRFKGRLTCLINGKRKSAPKRARIDLQNKVGKKTIDKSGTTVASKGNFSIILSYTSSRTLIFRFTNADGKRSQVSIKVKVQKAKKKKKKH